MLKYLAPGPWHCFPSVPSSFLKRPQPLAVLQSPGYTMPGLHPRPINQSRGRAAQQYLRSSSGNSNVRPELRATGLRGSLTSLISSHCLEANYKISPKLKALLQLKKVCCSISTKLN